jgi:hypothetical protein
MNISKLLATRRSILRQAYLANVAQAYVTLTRLAGRIANARLRGAVRLRPADPAEERYWPTLTAFEGSQAVIDEHFTEDEVMDLADAMAFATEADSPEIQFPIERLGELFAEPLRAILEQAGISVESDRSKANLTADNTD